jgi:hypothetical protein
MTTRSAQSSQEEPGNQEGGNLLLVGSMRTSPLLLAHA